MARGKPWSTAPRDALWYGEVVFEDDNGQTDYTYGYSATRYEPDAETLLPRRMRDRIIDSKVLPTPRNPEYDGPHGESE